MSKLTDFYIHNASLQKEGKTKNRRDGYLLRVLQNSKITYRPHCPGTGGGAFKERNSIVSSAVLPGQP